MNPLVPTAGFAGAAVNVVMAFLKPHLLDKVLDPNSQLYDWVTRALVFLLNLLASAVVFLLSGGTAAGAWQIIISGLAGAGISLGIFHGNDTANTQRVSNVPPAQPVIPPVVGKQNDTVVGGKQPTISDRRSEPRVLDGLDTKTDLVSPLSDGSVRPTLDAVDSTPQIVSIPIDTTKATDTLMHPDPTLPPTVPTVTQEKPVEEPIRLAPTIPTILPINPPDQKIGE